MSDINDELLNKIKQLLTKINNLQILENELLNNLKDNQYTLTEQEKNDILSNIKNITNLRIDLYKLLNDINTIITNSQFSYKNILENQYKAIDVIENEINQNKKNLENINSIKTNKSKLIQINRYYNKKYIDNIRLLKAIIIISIPIFVLFILENRGIISKLYAYISCIIILFIGVLFIYKYILGIMFYRDATIYDEILWPFDKSKAPKLKYSSIDSIDPWASGKYSELSDVCIGEECCSAGFTYDKDIHKCV